MCFFFFFSSRRRHTRCSRDWSSDVCSSDLENRVPGGDVNPYLAVAGLIAAGLHGIEHSLALEPPYTTNAYERKGPRVPTTLREAAELWTSSSVARAAF